MWICWPPYWLGRLQRRYDETIADGIEKQATTVSSRSLPIALGWTYRCRAARRTKAAGAGRHPPRIGGNAMKKLRDHCSAGRWSLCMELDVSCRSTPAWAIVR
ncbi:MAG: hypothetical protein R2911_15505 [Caldilineaceae bacterium]